MITEDQLTRGSTFVYAGGTSISPQPMRVVVVNCDGVDVWYRRGRTTLVEQTPVERFLEIVNNTTAQPDPFPRENFEVWMRELRLLGYKVETSAYDPETGIGTVQIKPPAEPDSLIPKRVTE